MCCFASCTSEEDTSSDAESTTVSDPYKGEDGNYVAQTSGKTYGGRTVTFLTCGVNPTYNSELVPSDRNSLTDTANPLPDVIDKAQADRIRYVEDQLDIHIEEQYVYDPARKNGLMLERIRQDNLVFLAEYQIVMPCLYDGATLSKDGSLINLYDLPGIQMDAPWWDQAFNREMTINGQLYFSIGDIGTVNKSNTAVILYNKDLYERFGLSAKYGGTPYDLVRSGQWTLDVLTEMTKELSNDLDGDGRIDYSDEFGYGGELGDMARLFYGANAKIASTATADGYPQLTMYSERNSRIIQGIQTLLQDKKHFVMADDYFGVVKWPSELLQKNFISGKSLFYGGILSTPIILGEMEQDFGMVPIPKGDTEQTEYYSLVSPWSSSCFAVPRSLPDEDLQLVSDVLNAMGAASANLVSKAFLEQCIEYMKSRDQDTIEMIEDYILPNRGCDIGMIYAWGGLVNVLHQMASEPIGAFTHSYQAAEAAAQADLDETIAFFKERQAS